MVPWIHQHFGEGRALFVTKPAGTVYRQIKNNVIKFQCK